MRKLREVLYLHAHRKRRVLHGEDITDEGGCVVSNAPFEIAGMRVVIASLEDAIEKLERENAALRCENARWGIADPPAVSQHLMLNGKAYSLDSMQRTLDVQADQIRELARVLYQHDMIRQRDLAQFEPRREGGAS
jgi:hypothetical protein